jgi:hypothetical protein
MEAMTLEKALEIIKQIAERHERDLQACAVAQRIDRERRNAIHAAQAASGTSGGNEPV